LPATSTTGGRAVRRRPGDGRIKLRPGGRLAVVRDYRHPHRDRTFAPSQTLAHRPKTTTPSSAPGTLPPVRVKIWSYKGYGQG